MREDDQRQSTSGGSVRERGIEPAREAELVEQNEALKRQLHGKKTEKMPRPTDAMRKADGTNADPKKTIERRRANAEARAELPTEIETHRVPDSERSCPSWGDGSGLRPLGEGRRTTEYDYVPGYFRRRVRVQEVLSCSCGSHVVTAPARVDDHCQYGPGFLAHLIVAKCADSIPIFRLEKAYARLGIPVSRSSTNELFHRIAELLEPIHQRLLASMRDAFVVDADETPMLVSKTNRRGCVWTFRVDGRVAYVFSKGRGATRGAGVEASTSDIDSSLLPSAA